MLPNEPIDILAIASRGVELAQNALRSASMMNAYAVGAQEYFQSALAMHTVASTDMNAVQALIRELSR